MITLLLLTLACGAAILPPAAGVTGAATGPWQSGGAAQASAAKSPGWPAHWIGVAVDNIPPIYSELLGLSPGQGLLVVRVVEASPAAAAGLHPGDLLFAVNAKPLESVGQLIEAANAHHGKTADSCKLQFIRSGVRHLVTVRPQLRPNLAMISAEMNKQSLKIRASRSNMRAFPPAAAGTAAAAHGVIVRMPGLEMPNSSLPYLFSVDKWTEINGRVQTMQLVAQGRTYSVDMAHLDKVPPRIALFARIFSRMRRQAAGLAAAPAAGKHMMAAAPAADSRCQGVLNLMGAPKIDLRRIVELRRKLARPLAGTMKTAAGTQQAFDCELLDAQAAGIKAHLRSLKRILADLSHKAAATSKR